MPSLSEYFAANRYHAQYEMGTRVSGVWNGIPFVGTIGNDTVVNENIGPQISVHLDLPLRYENTIHYVIITRHDAVKLLREYK